MRFRWMSVMSIAFVVSSCASSTEIPTVAEDPWATPEDQVVDAGNDSGPEEPKPPCGNGGSCNPNDLGGETCLGLGMGTGTLACDPVTCTYDTSMCEGASNGMGMGGSSSPGNGSGNNNGGMAGAGGNQTPFFGGGSGGSGNDDDDDESSDGGTPFFGGNFFGGGNNNPD